MEGKNSVEEANSVFSQRSVIELTGYVSGHYRQHSKNIGCWAKAVVAENSELQPKALRDVMTASGTNQTFLSPKSLPDYVRFRDHSRR
jgi:hypothetical protein